MRFLAIAGSLRAQSTNLSLLQALSLLARPGMEVVLYGELGAIPPFNPDLEETGNDGPVARFREAILEADAVIFSTPEYAHGIPGALKNALDWIVGSGELSEKCVVLVNASTRGTYAQAALREVLRTMNARVLTELEITVDAAGKKLPPEELAGTPEVARLLEGFLEELAVRSRPPG